VSRRWRYPRSRRGSFLQVPPPITAPTARALPPAWREQAGPRPRFAARIHRGVIFVAPVQAAAPATATRRRRLAVTARRGRFLAVPPAPVISVAPAFVPQFAVRRRPGLATTRRGHYVTAPPAPVTSAAPTWVPPILAAHRPAPRPVRRGRFTVCPAGQPVPVRQHRPRVGSVRARRGCRFHPPWTVAPLVAPRTPDRIRQHNHPSRPVPRRVRIAPPPWPQIVQVPPAMVPTFVGTRPRLSPPRRGCFIAWPVFQAAPPPQSTTRGSMSDHPRPGPGADGTDRPGADLRPTAHGGPETTSRPRRGASMGGS
jgi:hypothetical protein